MLKYSNWTENIEMASRVENVGSDRYLDPVEFHARESIKVRLTLKQSSNSFECKYRIMFVSCQLFFVEATKFLAS
jgi:hypothetical protein